ncbi:restriction endonuclease subunit S [Iodobacter fluviatilis]|uniref:EcoKI restriction-modification system protein HsdS n=1 Tax=Iodobacter fluviatilis TaxID=537 RepID=A0A377Q9K3_9NEIS|nr:restriction endonuclease subunit S [Iodobacter fluviatilis]TCU88551.1 type I restriction enzyme S subunit [Iodobacter fluviatilis]STQ91378.1 EcoKI restriction-modification system protein HsdS [Iodobacter fluviatilis]
MSEWRHVSLREIATHIKDGTHGTHQRVEVGVPFLSAKNIGSGGRLNWDKSDDLVSESDYAAITATFTPRRGDVLLTVVGSIGRAALFDGSRVAFQRSVAFVRGTNDALPEFLYQAIASADFIRQLESRCNVTAQAGLYLGELAKCRISLPPRERQQKIATILSCIDTTIEKTEALIAKYQQIKAGLMHDLFTRGVLPNGQLRPPHEQAPELYQETAIGWIPREWKIVRMIELAEDKKGSTTIGPFGSDLLASDYQVEGVPIVFVRDIKESGFEWNSETYVSEKKAIQLNAHRIKAGDVLATKMGLPPCISCLYPKTMPNAVMTADIIRLSPDGNKVAANWLTAAINHDRVKRQVAGITAGVTRLKVTLADFRGIKVAKPELWEQELVSQRLEVVQTMIDKENAHVDSLCNQKLGLMQDLLTGKVAVKVDDGVVEAAHG